VWTHQQRGAELSFEMHWRVNAELAQGDGIAYYEDLVPPKNGGCARCQRLHSDLATSGQQNEPYG
jgi:hypothetical protein